MNFLSYTRQTTGKLKVSFSTNYTVWRAITINNYVCKGKFINSFLAYLICCITTFQILICYFHNSFFFFSELYKLIFEIVKTSIQSICCLSYRYHLSESMKE